MCAYGYIKCRSDCQDYMANIKTYGYENRKMRKIKNKLRRKKMKKFKK